MRKSVIALLLTLALVVTVSVFAVSANNGTATTTPDYTLSIVDGVATAACPCPTHKGEVATFTEYTASSALSNGAHYYLSGNVEHTENRAVSTNHTAVIHLNGNTLSCSSNYVFNNWNSNTNLYLVADATKGGVVSTSRTHAAMRSSVGNVYSYNVTYTRAPGSPPSGVAGGTIALQGAGEFHMYGGTINGVVAIGNGGAVQITSGTFYMHSGTIQNCSATSGGAVYIGGGTFNLAGGTISNCEAANGGAVYIKAGTFNLNSGKIENCTATTASGAVQPAGGTFNMNGGEIKNCSAPQGGVSFVSGASSTINVAGGTIDSCTATNGGGAILVQYQSVNNTFSGGTIKNCSAPNGGAIYVGGSGNPKVTMSGTAKIESCTATSEGGAVYIKGTAAATPAHFELAGGEITECESKGGGGVSLAEMGILTISGGTLNKNKSTSSFGGNIRIAKAANVTFNFSRGTVSNGITNGNGGNLFCNQAALINITGGTFSGGTATAEGGSVCFINNVGAGSKIEGATFTGGTAGTVNANGTGTKNGGSLYLTAGNITRLYKCKFNGGVASYGGSIWTNRALTIEECEFNGTGGKAANGGFVCTSAATEFKNCSFTGGKATSAGGAVYTSGASKFTNCTFNGVGGNGGTYGGSIYAGGNVTIEGCKFGDETVADGNNQGGNSGSYGGSVYVAGGKTVTMKNCTVYGGQSHRGGVAFVEKGATLNVYGSTFKAGRAGLLGGNLATIGGTINVVNSTITGGVPAGTSSIKGGNIYVENHVVAATDTTEAVVTPGAVTIKNDSTLSGSSVPTTISDGTANAGGNVYVASGTFTMEDGTTISGGTSNGSGGNIYNTGTTDINGGKILDGTAKNHGGNIINSAGNLTADNCQISGGVAGVKNIDEETGKMIAPTVVGRGGNIALIDNGSANVGSAVLTNCDITDGESYDSNGAGGNIYLNNKIGEDKYVIDSCTITGGYGYAGGGNLQHHAAGTLTITGNTYIAGGNARVAGSNIYLGNQAAAVLKIEGNTEINAEGCNSVGSTGVNIHLGTTQSLYLGENVHVVGGGDKNHSIVAAGAGKIYLSGNAKVDGYIAMSAASNTANTTASVTAQKGFTGDVLLLTYYSTTGNVWYTAENGQVGKVEEGEKVETVYFGEEAPAYLKADNDYANTGTIKVHSQGRSGYVVGWTGEKFVIAGYTAFVPLAGYEDEFVEVGVSALDAQLPEGVVAVKLYTEGDGTVKVPAAWNNLPIDQNNKAVHFDTTNIETLQVYNYRTRLWPDRTPTSFTVDDSSKVALKSEEPETGYTYLNIYDDEKGTWTSNSVRISLKKVNLRPSMKCTDPDHGTGATCCGIYYTAKITANAIASAKILDYGIVAGLNLDDEQIPDNFMENGNSWWRWTCKGVEPGTVFYDADAKSGLVFNGGMVGDIMCTGVADNATRGAAGIDAKAYVTAKVGDQEIKILSDEQESYSVKTLADKLAEMFFEFEKENDTDNMNKISGFLNGTFESAMETWADAENLVKFYGLA